MNQSSGRILFLGPDASPLLKWLEDSGEDVIHTSDRISADFIVNNQIWFLVSYGYRHILRADVLELLPDRAINLHISYLPWNRGADPNLWSIVEDSPRGVSIHFLDEGIDTGDIIAQKQVDFDFVHDTLATSYEKLQQSLQQLFRENWPAIKGQCCTRFKQTGTGSMHRVKDRASIEHLLTSGWNTPISALHRRLK